MVSGLEQARMPAVAGAFYPAHPEQLKTAVERFLVRTVEPRKVMALLAPHAGYIYSGQTAGKVYAASELPKRLIILCPNHTGRGAQVSCVSSGTWKTPLGLAKVDSGLAGALMKEVPACKDDPSAHEREHAIEVQLPFLQVYLGDFTFLPIAVGVHDIRALIELGRGMANVMKSCGEECAIIVSTDMNHYEDSATNRRKDDLALERVLALDADGLHRVCMAESISMCGFAPSAAAIAAAKALGANRARLVDYTHSGMVTGDDSDVVSYAGVQIWRE